jgi:chemotaxis protein CheD
VVLYVGIAEMKISSRPGDVIVTQALGSCLGVVLYDPVAAVGGILHAMLPDSGVDPRKASTNPSIFVDTGLASLLQDACAHGAERSRLSVKVAGGAVSRPDAEDGYFQIGRRNVAMVRKVLWRNQVPLDGSDVGGIDTRTLVLEIGSGQVSIKAGGRIQAI